MTELSEASGERERPSWFDSHCHLDFEDFGVDLRQVLTAARSAGVERFLVPGTEPAQWPQLETLRSKYPELHFAVGIHPAFLSSYTDDALNEALDAIPYWAERLAARAVGECGLDGRAAVVAERSMERQLPVFERQLELCDELGLPLILHIVRAHEVALETLRSRTRIQGVVHSFTGSPELAREYLDLGLHLGIGGGVTYSRARKVREAVKQIPKGRLLLETDAPDQPPEGVSGRNQSAELLRVARVVAELRGESMAELAAATTANARGLFGV